MFSLSVKLFRLLCMLSIFLWLSDSCSFVKMNICSCVYNNQEVSLHRGSESVEIVNTFVSLTHKKI